MASIVSWHNIPPEQLLTERFHITNGFHPGQRDIIERLVQGQRVLAIQRTGWGKSLCYQMASLYYPHLTIVFSPLKALMRDQCQRCNTAYNIPAAIISSDFTLEENEATLKRAVAGEYTILFIAPERLSNALWQTYVTQMRISMIVIDEAHCISTWGHDFRPQYRRIVRLINALPKNTPVLALTASATKRVEEDILQQMGAGVQVIRGTMQRPNLHVQVVRVNGDQDKLGYLAEVLLPRGDTGIIYTATQSSAEVVAAFLQGLGMNAEYYHAEREAHIRLDIEQKFMANHYKVVCSTNALGMGIDKSDIRFVIHYHVPASPLHYYQEIGRAGRDGKDAWCILLYDPADMAIQEHFIFTAKPEAQYYEAVLSYIRQSNRSLQHHELLLAISVTEQELRNILADLEEQHFITYHAQEQTYSSTRRPGKIDFSGFEIVRSHRQQELAQMQRYATGQECYMNYLTAQLGEQEQYVCGHCGYCQQEHFPYILPSERIQTAVLYFLHEDFMPCIERYHFGQYTVHERGWSLSYHGKTNIGKQVRASKYEGIGPFALSLVTRAVEVIRARYPLASIQGIVSVPPTKSGALVETFARQIAEASGIAYLPVMAKIHNTREQKALRNRLQKTANMQDAFSIRYTEHIAGATLLLIDDIYDSGATIRAAAQALMQAGARAVYPLTITRTIHSNDQ